MKIQNELDWRRIILIVAGIVGFHLVVFSHFHFRNVVEVNMLDGRRDTFYFVYGGNFRLENSVLSWGLHCGMPYGKSVAGVKDFQVLQTRRTYFLKGAEW